MVKKFYQDLLKNFETVSGPFLRFGQNDYSYSESFNIITRIYSKIAHFGQKKIVVYAPKSVEGYCALYAVLFSNNIWIPLSPSMPAQRIEAIVQSLGDDFIVLHQGELPECLKKYSFLNLDQLDSTGGNRSIDKESLPQDKNQLAYIMFTSGSTGTPKGVPMTHQNYINFVNNALKLLPFKNSEVFSDYHEFSFDISIFYLFCAPLTASCLAPITRSEDKLFPLKHAQDNHVTVWSSVPSMIAGIKRMRPHDIQKSSIRIMFLCGEPLALGILEYCLKNLEVPHNYNFYGLTETGVENFYYPCNESDLERFSSKGFLPIGQPLPGNEVMMADDKELLIAGDQITPGYLNGIEKNRFIQIDQKIWYKTGDVVEKFDDVYFCKGRKDSQVKLGGHRVELMDIEVNLRNISNIKEAICFVEEYMGSKRLVASLHLAKQEDFNPKDISSKLKMVLPEYMVPKKYYLMNEIPYNDNGKIDRKKVKQQIETQIS